MYFEHTKNLIKNNAINYFESVISCLEERFGELGEDDLDIEIDERVSRGDKILHNICRVLDSRNWVLPETMAVTIDNVIT